MDKMLQGIGLIVLTFGIIFISPMLSMLVGAWAGWLVAICAPIWVPTGLKILHINVEVNQLVELGAALGFISGFFRINLDAKKDK